MRIGIAALLSALLLVSALVIPAQAASPTAPADTVEARLRADVARLSALPESARDAAALEPSARVLDNAPEAIDLYGRLDDPAQQRELLRLMAVTGSAAFLPVFHAALAGGAHVALALRATVALGDPASAQRVAPFLRSPEPERVVLALHYFTARPQALPADALPALLRHPAPAVRAALLPLLGARGDPAALDACGAALQGGDPAVQATAVDCLGRLGGPAAAERLLAAFDDAPTPLQARMVGALLLAEPAASYPHLESWLQHPAPAVAVAALVALQVQGDPRRVPALMERIERGAPALAPALLVKALGLTDDDRAVPFLGRRLQREEERARRGADTTELRLAMIEALGALGRLAGQRYLAPYLSGYDPRLRNAAIDALRRIGAGRR